MTDRTNNRVAAGQIRDLKNAGPIEELVREIYTKITGGQSVPTDSTPPVPTSVDASPPKIRTK